MDKKLIERFESSLKQATVPAYSMFSSDAARHVYQDAKRDVEKLTPILLLEIAKALQRLEAAQVPPQSDTSAV